MASTIRLLLLFLVLVGAGCQRSAAFNVRVDGMKIPAQYAATVEVTNWNGAVQVYASDRFDEPSVRANVVAVNDSAPRSSEDLRATVTVRAHTVEDGGRRIFRVTCQPAPGTNEPVAANLQVRIPRASGVRIITSGGPVEVVGISGPVIIQNGAPGRPGGDVELRTGMPMTEAVSISTTEGQVLYLVGPGSTGDFDLKAAGGMPQVEARVGTISGITYKTDRWKGRLDSGKNNVSLESGKGDVRVVVVEDAGAYGKEYWDGWPKWPSSPRWVAKLAGE